MSEEYLLQMKNINKAFFGVQVLKDVSLEVKKGEVHALIGENGAGKSTLMKILTGIYSKDSGDIFIDGEKVSIRTADDAIANGIAIMHQEISLIPQLMIYENVYVGREIVKKNGFLDKNAMKSHVQQVLDDLELDLRCTDTVENLSVAKQQMVEVAKALAFNSRLIIMDEPTAALTEKEVASLMAQIKLLRSKGISIIYISHRMPEIFEVCDSATVYRDGQYIGRVNIADVDVQEIIRMMVGRKIEDIYGVEQRVRGKDSIIFEARNLVNKYLKDVSFQLKEGEILGFAGLVGAGRTELSRAIYGIDKLRSGQMLLKGNQIENRNPMDAIKRGFSLVPEDRKNVGLIQSHSVAFNLTLPVLRLFINRLRVDKKKERKIIDEYAYKLSIKMSSPNQYCRNLSGGNQQKVVLSKCLVSEPEIIILDEPTRGIDVGTKSEIYRLIQEMTKEGKSVIFISSELPEIINLSSRIAVMHEGKLVKIFNEEETACITQEMVMSYATGGHDGE